jgi:hypothetical protein
VNPGGQPVTGDDALTAEVEALIREGGPIWSTDGLAARVIATVRAYDAAPARPAPKRTHFHGLPCDACPAAKRVCCMHCGGWTP